MGVPRQVPVSAGWCGPPSPSVSWWYSAARRSAPPWLVGRHTFPRRWFSWLLVLPLALPAYVLGFVYLGLLDHPGPVQSGLRRRVFGPDVWFPEVRSFWLGALVLIVAFYPYPYLLARRRCASRRRRRTRRRGRWCRSAGGGAPGAAPLARPSLAAGALLVAMETLTDFATVQYFDLQTVSVGIYQVWVGQYDRAAASELAGVVLLFALAVIAAEQVGRGGARFYQHSAGRSLAPDPFHGRAAALATGTCARPGGGVRDPGRAAAAVEPPQWGTVA